MGLSFGEELKEKVLQEPVLYTRLSKKQKKDLDMNLSKEEKRSIEITLRKDDVPLKKKILKGSSLTVLIVLVGLLSVGFIIWVVYNMVVNFEFNILGNG